MLEIENNYIYKKHSIYTFVNPYSYVRLCEELSAVDVKKFEILADGIFVVIVENILKQRRLKRVSFDFTSIAWEVFSAAEKSGESISFIGSTDVIVKKFENTIKNMFPSLVVLDSLSGYFDLCDRAKVLSCLSNADIVVVGMGTPLQEKILLDLKASGWSGVGYTCGGFIEQTALAEGIYYPRIIDRLNLRWFYRILKEPRKLWYRYLVQYPYFLFYYIRKFVQ